jgi:hypothetical protein
VSVMGGGEPSSASTNAPYAQRLQSRFSLG